MYEFPETRPTNGVLAYTLLTISKFDEVDAVRCVDWPGKVLQISRSSDELCWELRLLDPTIPVAQVDGANLPIVQTIPIPDPATWGTRIGNSEPIEIGDRSFLMFISKETAGGINHIWIAEIGLGKTWVRKVDDIPAGGNGLIITDPEWSGGGEVITAYDAAGKLYAFPTGITVSPCPDELPTLRPLSFTNGEFQLEISGVLHSTVNVQVSPDLVDWGLLTALAGNTTLPW